MRTLLALALIGAIAYTVAGWYGISTAPLAPQGPKVSAPAWRPSASGAPFPGGLPSQTRMPPPPAPGYWEISHPQGLLLKFADQAKCQETAEKLSQTFSKTVHCYSRSD